jgi:hypothetical protein
MCGRGGFDPAGYRTSDKRKTTLSATTVTVEGSSADRAGHKVLARGAEARMISAFLRPLQKKLKVRPQRGRYRTRWAIRFPFRLKPRALLSLHSYNVRTSVVQK